MRARSPQGDGSTRFHRVGDVEFWLTPANRIFLLVAGRQITPSLIGSRTVRYDDPTFRPPAAVEEALRKFLRTQQDIRSTWPTPEEDEQAFTYS